VLELHCTQALFAQCGLAVGQSVSAMHCTHPGVAIIPQRTGPPPPSSPVAPLEPPLEPPLELPPSSAPLDVPPELPPEPPLDIPLEEPPPDDPLEDPDPPSELVLELLPLQPTPTATAVAIARPRDLFNNDMACLTSYRGFFVTGSRVVCDRAQRERGAGSTRRSEPRAIRPR
jgi:hypothetical protein